MLCKLEVYLGNCLLTVNKWSLLLFLTCPCLFHETRLILVSVITKITIFAQYLRVAKRKEGCRERGTYWIKRVGVNQH